MSNEEQTLLEKLEQTLDERGARDCRRVVVQAARHAASLSDPEVFLAAVRARLPSHVYGPAFERAFLRACG